MSDAGILATMAGQTIGYDEFRRLIARRAQRLFCALIYLKEHRNESGYLTRPLLGDLLSQATQVEELLDGYGARNNRHWHTFRSFTATIKLFSNVSYELLHIEHSLPLYQLLPLEQDFEHATDETIDFAAGILSEIADRMIDAARDLGLRIPELAPCLEIYRENLPAGRLEQNLDSRKVEAVSKTVPLLATAFLNLAAESKPSLPCLPIRPEEYEAYARGPVTEDKLRSLEFQFHNLQSLYDTYVSKTETEGLDHDLPVLRGHISVVLHLLRTATDFAHYYERHVDRRTKISADRDPLVEPERLLATLMNYSVHFAGQYLASAEVLCQEMLQRYTEVGEIEVRVPQYRGFHVRPSTLIAKLVLHYGSKVQMEMDGDRYDAGSPLELFRANEKINARKRQWLAREILRLKIIPDELPENEEVSALVRNVVLQLAERSKIIIYEQPLHLSQKPLRADANLFEQVTDEIARLQATGKIDIGTDLRIRFIGDKRVLEDIRLLAESGYGEDNFGNNIALPEALSYLRRT